MRALDVYVDTSVFGGVFDDEFADASSQFFEQVRTRRFRLAVSDLTAAEISQAPQRVIDLFQQHSMAMVLIELSADMLALRDAYLQQGVVEASSADDATHVAAATVSEVDLIVSWNFRHIVHFDKIRQYNAVSVLHGYRELDIRSPAEVIAYEDEDI